MGRINFNLGYGRRGDVEIDSFTQLLTEQVNKDQQVRADKPTVWDNTFEYLGIAPIEAFTSDLLWNIIRITWVNNKRIRWQFQESISWDNRTQGWPI